MTVVLYQGKMYQIKSHLTLEQVLLEDTLNNTEQVAAVTEITSLSSKQEEKKMLPDITYVEASGPTHEKLAN